MTRKPPTETSYEDATSRRGRLLARRSRRTRISIVVAVILIAGGIAAAAYALNNSDPQAHANGANEPPTTFGKKGTLVSPNAVKAPEPRPLDHQHPLKLWVGGDSLAGSFGPALGDQVGATGIVSTVIDYKVSSGLASNDIRNWSERATEQMASDNPDAVVFIIGTNDAPIVNKVDNNGDNIPDWEAAYRLKVAHMMDLLVGPNRRTVFWLGPPTLGDQNMDAGAKAIGPIMREEALKRAPDVVYLDTYALFSGKDGTYSRYISDENGNEITARISDGTHFSQDGAEYLARAVFSLIDARWKLTTQADLKDPIGWTSAQGSGELVPGYSQQPQSRYNGGSSSGDTTPETSGVADPTTVVTFEPTTAAPSTTPRTIPVTTTAPKATTPPPTTVPTPTTTPPA